MDPRGTLEHDLALNHLDSLVPWWDVRLLPFPITYELLEHEPQSGGDA